MASLVLAVALLVAPSAASAAPSLERIGTFTSPIYVNAAPGDNKRLFITERGGTIRVQVDGVTRARPFLRLPAVSLEGEGGLLSMAFDPGYDRNRRLYVFYARPDGDIQIDEFKRKRGNPNRVRPSSRRPVLTIDHSRATNHYGGQLQFGPDNLLYISTGDGGGATDPANAAQDRSSLLGKILRIDPRQSRGDPYRIPRDNPFVGRSGRNEIYHYGLRNPWRFSFDRFNGNLFIGDVGQVRLEEVDVRTPGQAGANFGWNCFEGTEPFLGGRNCLQGRPHVEPVFEYGHDQGCSITGGYVARHPSLGDLNGRYLYSDFCDRRIRALTLTANGLEGVPLGIEVPKPVSFGEGPRGQLYVASLEGGVFRIRG